jgi:hypothetical protein
VRLLLPSQPASTPRGVKKKHVRARTSSFHTRTHTSPPATSSPSNQTGLCAPPTRLHSYLCLDRPGVAMLQLLMALAFSAAPLTLYVPPVRSLSLFVEAVCRDCAPYSHGAVLRLPLPLPRARPPLGLSSFTDRSLLPNTVVPLVSCPSSFSLY